MKYLFLFGLLALSTFGVYAEDADVDTVETPEVVGEFSEEEVATMKAGEETHEFQAEVSRLMDIIINSLYSNREIFLREIISNSADALDKIRYQSLTDKSVLGEGDAAELDIRIKFDKDAKTLTLTDKGVGMTKDELVANLGTVAKSGTTEFVEAAASGSDSLSLIGQFGVGFYSVYLVADKVTVASKSFGDVQHVWESTAENTFTITADPRGDTLGHGTSVTLHLKEDAEEFLSEATLEKLVGRYSEFINFPIYLQTTKTVTREEPIEEDETADDEAAPEEAEETAEDDDELEVVEEEEDDAPKTKTISEEVKEWKLLNSVKAIWTRSPADITDDEYEAFYKALTKDESGSLSKIHFTAEGEITFRSILYIPNKAEPGLYDRFYEKSTSLKLYVRRVLISDEFDDFLPRYLNFVRGVVDSEDLPLNVSRETLAQSRVLKVMSKKITRKVLEMLRKLSEEGIEDEDDEEEEETDEAEKEVDEAEKEDEEEKEDRYKTFWENFGKSIKLGLIDDRANKSKLAKLLRFTSTKSDGELISLEDYVEGMEDDQEFIYYITGENLEAVQSSPFLERLAAKDLEVIYMIDPLDEYVVQSLTEFDGNNLQSVTKEGLKLGDESRLEAFKEEYSDFGDWLKQAYDGKVEKVEVSNRLASSPCVLVTGQYGWSANMERIMKAQTFADASKQNYMMAKKTMEINPRHPIIQELKTKSEEAPEDAATLDLANLLFDAALVSSGFTVGDAVDFASRIHRVIGAGLGVDPNAELAPEPVEEEAEPEEEAEEEAEVEDEAEAEPVQEAEVEDEAEAEAPVHEEL